MNSDIQATPRAPDRWTLLGHSTPRPRCKGWRSLSVAIGLLCLTFHPQVQAATNESLNFDFDTSAEAQRRILRITQPTDRGIGFIGFGIQNQSNFGLLGVIDQDSDALLRSPLALQNILTLWADIGLPLDLALGLKLPGLILQDGGPIGLNLQGPQTAAFSDAELALEHRYRVGGLKVAGRNFPLQLHSQARLSSGALSADAYAGSPTPELVVETIGESKIAATRGYLGLGVGLRGSIETQGVSQGSHWHIIAGALHPVGTTLSIGAEVETRFDTFSGNPRAHWRATALWEEPQTGTWSFGLGTGLHNAPGNPALLVHAGWSSGTDSFTDRDADERFAIEDGCPDRAEDFDGFQDEDGCPDLDNDEDGIPDQDDACPLEPEDLDGIQDEDGCFEDDADQDTFPDTEDKCPLQAEDFDQFQDQDGCPEPDNDDDGFVDQEDSCPLEAEDVDEFQDQDGCPEPDNDEDGILDADDECPNAEGPADGEPPGCPAEETIQIVDDKVMVESVEGKEVLGDVVFFAYGRIHLKRSARPILNQIVKLLNRDDTIAQLRVVGHTDSSGAEEANRKLSQWRADAVKRYLIKRGVADDRIEAIGLGSAEPVASNLNKEGRIKNRRVEFILIRTPASSPNQQKEQPESMNSIVDDFLAPTKD